jgi:two-component system response regulator MprA
MRVLVVDDDAEGRVPIEKALVDAGYSVQSAQSGQQALDLFTESVPGALVLDLDLPDLDGAELCRRVRRVDARMPILVISSRDAIEDRIRGLDAGGDFFLAKPCDGKELIARLGALLRRLEPPDEPWQLSFAELRLDASRYALRVDDRCEELTKTEYALLEMFMASPGRLFSPTEIYERVWKAERPDPALLYVYIGYLRRRLRDAGARALIHTVPGHGYVMQDPADPDIATPHGSSSRRSHPAGTTVAKSLRL